MCSLIRMAFDVKDYQVLSIPPRMDGKEPSSWYAIEARGAAGVTLTIEQTRLMLQTMLAERFKLKFHREPRQAPVYALVVAKGGHKLGTEDKKWCTEEKRVTFMAGPGLLRSCKPGLSISQLIISLNRDLDRPVVDRTDLAGTCSHSNGQPIHWPTPTVGRRSSQRFRNNWGSGSKPPRTRWTRSSSTTLSRLLPIRGKSRSK